LLPPATERVWNFLKAQPVLKGFVLIGGSALALRIRHRRSEDLDCVFPGIRLPRERLDVLRRNAVQAGFDFQHNDDEAAAQAFEQDGLELYDYQQDLLVNGEVRLSFFAPDEPVRKILSKRRATEVRIATLAAFPQPRSGFILSWCFSYWECSTGSLGDRRELRPDILNWRLEAERRPRNRQNPQAGKPALRGGCRM
jgi:hypothetical protein